MTSTLSIICGPVADVFGSYQVLRKDLDMPMTSVVKFARQSDQAPIRGKRAHCHGVAVIEGFPTSAVEAPTWMASPRETHSVSLGEAMTAAPSDRYAR
jgi:hypothetical protein